MQIGLHCPILEENRACPGAGQNWNPKMQNPANVAHCAGLFQAGQSTQAGRLNMTNVIRIYVECNLHASRESL